MPGALLSRKAFRDAVLRRSDGRCVFCGAPAVDAHHVIERKLFPDGGYVLENGAAVCENDHWRCETGELSPEVVRRAAGILEAVLPPGFPPGSVIDKWGNTVRSDGLLEPGPLFDDVGARRALAAGGRLGLFIPKGTLT